MHSPRYIYYLLQTPVRGRTNWTVGIVRISAAKEEGFLESKPSIGLAKGNGRRTPFLRRAGSISGGS
jgi:hypothetical protein